MCKHPTDRSTDHDCQMLFTVFTRQQVCVDCLDVVTEITGGNDEMGHALVNETSKAGLQMGGGGKLHGNRIKWKAAYKIKER